MTIKKRLVVGGWRLVMTRRMVVAGVFAALWCGLASAETDAVSPARALIGGFAPDPSVCRVGDDYYLINSSFAWFPGLPIYHSRDLRNWTLVDHALKTPEWRYIKDFTNEFHGVWAPTIRHYDGKFYICCTLRFPDHGRNFVITSESIHGPWSKPVWPDKAVGIDLSIFRDDDGKFYLQSNCVTPGWKPDPTQPNLGRHQSMWNAPWDPVSGKLTGSRDILPGDYTGEGPHIFKFGSDYLLTIAAGHSKEDGHCSPAFIAPSLKGPWRTTKTVPALTWRHRSHKDVDFTGHCDLAEASDGDLFAVFLGFKHRSPGAARSWLGRETFACKAKFTGDDLVFDLDHLIEGKVIDKPGHPYEVPDPRVRLNFIRNEDFVHTISVTTKDGRERGLAVYKSLKNHFYLIKGKAKIRLVAKLNDRPLREIAALPFAGKTAILKVRCSADKLQFFAGESEQSLQSIGAPQEAKYLGYGYGWGPGVGTWEDYPNVSVAPAEPSFAACR